MEFQDVVRRRRMVRRFRPEQAIAIGLDAESERLDLSARRRPAADLVHFGRWSPASS